MKGDVQAAVKIKNPQLLLRVCVPVKRQSANFKDRKCKNVPDDCLIYFVC